MAGRLHSDVATDNLWVVSNQFIFQGDVSHGETLLADKFVQNNRKSFMMSDWSGKTNSFGTGNRSLRHWVEDDSDSIEGETNRSAAGLLNSKSVLELIERIDKGFDLLYSKRAFVHWIVREGIEEGEFSEAREDLAVFEMDWRYEGNQSWGECAGEGEGEDEEY